MEIRLYQLGAFHKIKITCFSAASPKGMNFIFQKNEHRFLFYLNHPFRHNHTIIPKPTTSIAPNAPK